MLTACAWTASSSTMRTRRSGDIGTYIHHPARVFTPPGWSPQACAAGDLVRRAHREVRPTSRFSLHVAVGRTSVTVWPRDAAVRRLSDSGKARVSRSSDLGTNTRPYATRRHRAAQSILAVPHRP